MGKTTDAFKREIGKNTGKAVSNWIFGDAHATPYRRVDKSKSQKLEAQAKEIDGRNEREHRNQMFSLDAAVLENVDTVANIRVPYNKEDLMELLLELSTHLEANKWHSTFDKDKEDEAKIRNKFCDALLSKYSFCLKKLQTIDNSEPQLFYFESVARKAKRNRFLKTHPILLLLSLFFFLWFILIPIIYAIDGDYSAIMILLISLLLISIICIPYYTIRGIKYKKLKKLRTPKYCCPEKSTFLDKFENDNEVNTKDDLKTESKPIIAKLNENNRIETALASIWDKYYSLIDIEIIGRKPIFPSEGIHNSILFVGVNPSYVPEDDNILRKTKNGKALYYGNQYRMNNAPVYFKELEKLSDKIGLPYTHINLLYARENDRDKLLHENIDFIREQLELTYETILQINPAVIVFFSGYARKLIFGKERWIDPNSEFNGSYHLRGTFIPAFFSDDIMEMTPQSRENLIIAVRQTI